MGWLDNLWRRRQGRTTSSEEDTAQAQKRQQPDGSKTADELEEAAHQHRDEEIFREPRIPPGTG
jgi:hypothetical protein